MSTYTDIKETLDSPGARHIVRALRSYHKTQWRRLRDCRPEELADIQAVMKAIDGALPLIITQLMNSHLDPKKDKNPELWFKFDEYAKQIKNKIEVKFNPLTHIKVKVMLEGGHGERETIVPVGYDPSVKCVMEPGPMQYHAIISDGSIYPIVVFPFGVIYDGILRQHGISPWRQS